ncbi:MAG: CHAT domain-containing protein [Nocardioidaceae bacterium]
MLSAVELHRRGLEKCNAGRYDAARKLLLRAEIATAPGELRARIQVTLAHVEAELGTAERGLEICRTALDNPGLASEVRGLILSQTGLLHTRAGNGNAALVCYSEALPLLRGDHASLARVHLNRGNVYLQRRQVSEASKDMQAASAHYESAGLVSAKAKALHNLGYAQMLAGDVVGALTAMNQARPMLAELSETYRAVCDKDRAEVLLAAGMTADAAEALAAAAVAFGSRGIRQMQGEAELALARLLMRDDAAESIRVARRASRRFAKRGSDVWRMRADAVVLMAEVEKSLGTPDLTSATLELSVELDREGLHEEALDLKLQAGRNLTRLGDGAAVREILRSVRVRKATPLATRLLRHEVATDLRSLEGRRRQALTCVRDGLAELDDWQSSFGSLDLRTSLVGHGRRLASQGLRLALDDGRPEVLFEWSERARALASKVTPVRPPLDPEGAAHLTELRHLQAQIRSSGAGRGIPATLSRREVELQRQIRQRAWFGAGSGQVDQPAAMEEVQASLGSTGGRVLSYVYVDGGLHALAISAERAELFDLGPYAPVGTLLAGMQADLDMAATNLPASMRDAVRGSLDQRLARISDYLVKPLCDQGDERLVIVPAGALAGTPWSMLPGFAGRPLTVPRSATFWLSRRGQNFASTTAGFVAGPRVERADEEVVKAASTWPRPTVLSGEEACAAAVDELAGRVDVLHIAAHGRHSADNPLFSGLELADGPWYGYDIDRLSSIPTTLVLSACEMGRSTVRWGEESIGMAIAWLHAGAWCVIASPASVNDDVACEVLAATHSHLAEGATPADALAAAEADLPHPDASPFMCFGVGW